MSAESRAHALQIFRAALRAADAHAAVTRNLKWRGDALQIGEQAVAVTHASRIIVVGAGKAGGAMAQAVEQALGTRVSGGLVSVKEGHGAPTRVIEICEASHPLPDERTLANGRAIIERVRGLNEDDVVLCLISGGGSALMEALGEGLSLDQLRVLTRKLMHAGANIVELNCVRKHLSLIKGGQLARWAQPATTCALILSDVVGDDLSSIASGPTAPDPTTFLDALDLIERCGLRSDAESASIQAVLTYLQRGARGELPETPKPDDALFARVHNFIIGSNALALNAMAHEASMLGYASQIVSTTMDGEARDVGCDIARFVRARNGSHQCLLWGGETTVTVNGHGRGGRNQELALAAAMELDGAQNTILLSAATDGGDGSSDAAGAIADGDTLRRTRALGLDAQQSIAQNDSHYFFAALGDQVITGPTLTNVNDVVIALIQ